MARVLCTDVDPGLLRTRRMILERAGHRVTSATSEPEVRDACTKHTVDVAVIGQTISGPQKKLIFALVRELWPTARILELHGPHTDRELSEADDWLEVPAQVPLELASKVTQLAGLVCRQTPNFRHT